MFEVDDRGAFTSFVVAQSAAPEFPTIRRHRIGIGLYDVVDDTLTLRHRVEVDVEGESTVIAELVGEPSPTCVLLNDGDLTYAKIRLDERSLKTAIDNIDKVDDSLARALLWGAAWDMTRDAEMRATDFVALVLRGIGTETDLTAVSRLPVYARTAIHYYAAPEHRDALKATWEQGLRGLLEGAEPGSDHQLAFLRAYARAAHSDEALDYLEGLLDGSVTVPGLEVDTDLRWTLLTGLSLQRPGRRGPHPGGAGARQHHLRPGARGHGAAPSARRAEAKAQAWQRRDRARRRAQRDAAPDRRGVPGGRPGRAAGAVPREVPRGRPTPSGRRRACSARPRRWS